MRLEELIRKLAVEGHSKAAAIKIIGISHAKLRCMLETMPDIEWPRSRIPLTSEMAEHIEKLCKYGHSRAEAAKILEIPISRMRVFCRRMPDLVWASRSLTRINTDNLRGEVKDAYAHLNQNLQQARDLRKAQSKRTVRGITGDIPELLAHFRIGLSPSTIRRRLAEGKTIEEALFAPTPPRRPKIRDWFVGSLLRSGPFYQVRSCE